MRQVRKEIFFYSKWCKIEFIGLYSVKKNEGVNILYSEIWYVDLIQFFLKIIRFFDEIGFICFYICYWLSFFRR